MAKVTSRKNTRTPPRAGHSANSTKDGALAPLPGGPSVAPNGRSSGVRHKASNPRRPVVKPQRLTTPDGLTPAQYTFGLEYLANGFNARRAYMKAHPRASVATADAEGYRTLREPQVLAFLRPQVEEGWKAQKMSGEEALGRIALVASADIRLLFDDQGQMLPPHLWPPDIAVCVKSVQITPHGLRVTLLDKLQALRTILEQTGKLRATTDSFSALAEAIRADRTRSARLLARTQGTML